METYESISKVDINIKVNEKVIAKGILYRHLSPVTVNHLMDKIPLQGRINRFKNKFIYFLSLIRVGVEKGKKKVKKGEIGFLSSNGAICFFLEDCELALAINPLGEISTGLDFLHQVKSGDIISLYINSKI